MATRRSTSSNGDTGGDHASLPGSTTSRTALRRRGAGPGGAAGAMATAAATISTSGRPSAGVDGAHVPGQPIGYLAARGTPYQKKFIGRKLTLCCLTVVPVAVIITAVITFLPVLHAIALHALHTSVLHVYQSNITSPLNGSFTLTLEGQVKKTGIFPAHIFFQAPIDVYWVTPDTLQEKHLGHFDLDYLGAAAGHARLKQETTFNIDDQDAFGQFTEFLITQEEFTWQLRCPKVQAKAFSFIAANGLTFKKDFIAKGFNNFENVEVLDFQLPGDDPAGGVSLLATTSLYNPSPFGVQLGRLAVDLYYDGMYLGPAVANNVNITAGRNIVSLEGRLVDHIGNQTELDMTGKLFTRYINSEVTPTIARGVSATLLNGEHVTWLSQGIKALNIDVPLKPPAPINPIKSIEIDYLDIAYTPNTAYDPVTNSNSVKAYVGLPFGFSLNITQTANQFAIVMDNQTVATLNGALSQSATALDVVSSGQTAGTLHITLPPTPLQVAADKASHARFQDFQKALTLTDGSEFYLNGSSVAVTDTPLGQVVLDGIQFYVPSGLLGLKGLDQYPTLINGVDVVGGTRDYLQLSINTSLVNPSNLNLAIGDSTFQLFNNEALLGTATMPNLNLTIGRNDITATSTFNPNEGPIGMQILNDFASGHNSLLNITGFSGSTNIDSLVPALGSLALNSTLPGLPTKLVNYANLTVLDTTGVTNNIAHTIVGLDNPFSSGLTVTSVNSNIHSHGLYVGNISQPLTFNAPGKQLNNIPGLNLDMNLYPPDIFSLVRALMAVDGQDLAQIDGIVQLGGYKLTPSTNANSGPGRRRDVTVPRYVPVEEVADEQQKPSFITEADDDSVAALLRPGANYGPLGSMEDMMPGERDEAEADDDDDARQPRFGSAVRRAAPLPPQTRAPELPPAKRSNIYTGYNLPNAVDSAFKHLLIDVELVSGITIGQYETTLNITQTDVPVGTDQSLNLLLPILAKPIVQKIVDGAVLGFNTITITNPAETSFGTELDGAITNAGPFDAVITFPEGLTISWEGKPLGHIAMPNVSLVGDVGAKLQMAANFAVADVAYLTNFTSYLLTQESFVWEITGENLIVSALGIEVSGISMTKEVMLKGMNGFKNGVVINSFDLPANDPAGGIHLTLQTTIINPAQIGVQLSSMGFQNTFKSTNIGPVAAGAPFTLSALSNVSLPLVGRLIPQSTPQGLADVSTIFTQFVHDIDSNLTVHGDYAGPPNVTWLNEGIKSLAIDVVLPAQKFDVIKSITLNVLDLRFTEPTSWDPSTTSASTSSAFYLPFAFPLDIQTISGQFIAGYHNTNMAVLNVPQVPAKTDVAARTLQLAFQNVPFAVYNGQHALFSQYLADVTAGVTNTFSLSGIANTGAMTAVGLLNISDIPFNVPTTILGLQNLNARPAQVSNLDVHHGYPTYLSILLDTALYNPSNITIGTGDVSFGLGFENHPIGSADISNLVIVPGVNTVPTDVHYQPEGANVPFGQNLLENYIQGVMSPTAISGTSSSTPIDSLKQALGGIALTADIPPLQQNLITQTSLEMPTDIVQTGMAHATFNLGNPFTATINMLQVVANATYNDLYLGQINVDLSGHPITAPGHTAITSPSLDFAFNLDPKVIIQLLLETSTANGVSLGPLVPLFQQVLNMPNPKTAITTTVSPDMFHPTCVSGQQFDVFDAILNSLKNLHANLSISAQTALDDYHTPLTFVQNNVPTITDQSALYLIGAVGAPIVQTLVDNASLSFSIANITGVTDEGFDVSLQGQLTGTGPFDAEIEFVQPVNVNWNGKDIAQITLPPVCADANVGVPNYVTKGHLTITHMSDFIDFATFLLHNPSFSWVISTNKLRVTALGTIFDNVFLSKTISFDAFNGLPGVTISNFQLPSDSADGTGIDISTDSLIPSPASLGIELGTVGFLAYFDGVEVGPISATNFFMAAHTVTNEHLTGEITHKSGSELQTMGVMFSNYLHGQNQTLQVVGQSVTPPGQSSPVGWLTTAFKTLTLQVTLPGHIYEIIESIQLQDLTVQLEVPADDYDALATNQHTDIVFKNPFGFSLSILETGEQITIVFNNINTVQLNTPLATVLSSGTSTGQPAPLAINFANQRLQSLNNANYGAFFAQLTDQSSATFGLNGGADVIAKTPIGNVPIQGIPFNVTTSLNGIQSFQHTAKLSNVSITGSGPGGSYLLAPLTVTMDNPSNLTVITNEVSLPVIFNGVDVGRALIPQLDLKPGSNSAPSEFHYMPANANDTTAQLMLSQYLMENEAPTALTVSGANAQGLSPYGALGPALQGVSLQTQLAGISARLVTHINVYMNLDTVLGGLENILNSNQPVTVEIDFDVHNPLDADLQIEFVQNDSGHDGTIYAHFDQPFSTFAVPSHGSANSGRFGNVVLTKGLLGSLAVIGQNLDIFNDITNSVGGAGGYRIPWLSYNETNVPTAYQISLGGSNIPIGSVAGLITGVVDGFHANSTSQVVGALSQVVGGATGVIDGILSNLHLGPTNAPSVASSSTPAAVTSVVSSVASPANSIVNPGTGATKPTTPASPASPASPSSSSRPGILPIPTKREETKPKPRRKVAALNAHEL